MGNETYRFVTGNDVVFMKETEKGISSVSCDFDVRQSVWVKYFDLNRNYRNIFEKEYGKNLFVYMAMNVGREIRILWQNPWEILVSIIISQ